MNDLAFWQTLLAGLAGGAITLIGQWLKGKQDRTTQVQALREERELSRSDRREEFELARLEELRHQVARLRTAAEELRVDFGVAESESGFELSDLYEANGNRPLDAELSTLRALIAVTLDPDLRKDLTALAEQTWPFVGDTHNHAGWKAYHEQATAAEAAVGARIRGLYGDD